MHDPVFDDILEELKTQNRISKLQLEGKRNGEILKILEHEREDYFRSRLP
jgi:hypothetical protein